MNVDKAEQLSAVLEDAIYSLMSVLEGIRGSDARAEDYTEVISDIITSMQEEKAECDCILDQEYRLERECLNREYERSVL